MSELPNARDLIDTAMQLPLSERVVLANALLTSMETNFGGDATQTEVDAAWQAEIAERINEIKSGKVQPIPSSEMWKRIGGKPSGRN